MHLLHKSDNLSGVRQDPTPESCLLTPTLVPWHACKNLIPMLIINRNLKLYVMFLGLLWENKTCLILISNYLLNFVDFMKLTLPVLYFLFYSFQYSFPFFFFSFFFLVRSYSKPGWCETRSAASDLQRSFYLSLSCGILIKDVLLHVICYINICLMILRCVAFF